MKFISLLWAGVALSVSGCVSASITPASVAAIPGRAEERAADLKTWNDAVSLCNAFLDSPERKTLPPGRVDFGEDGMTFVSGDVRLPMRVRCTTFGDLLIPFKMAAQERSDGFVVGRIAPKESRILDNSFFKNRSGRTISSGNMASLILHELTHSYYRLGTVGVPQTISYYAEAIFLLRYRNHSQERIPYRTSDEFRGFFTTLKEGKGAPGSATKREANQR